MTGAARKDVAVTPRRTRRAPDGRRDGHENPASRGAGAVTVAVDTARQVLALQRSAGNAAVSRLIGRTPPHGRADPGAAGRAVIQRKTIEVGRTIRDILGDEGMDVLAAYNDIEAQGPAGERMRLLSRLYRSVYAWYNEQDTYDFETIKGKAPSRIKDLEAVLDEEYRRAVQDLVEEGETPPPGPEELDGDEGDEKARKRLWRSLVSDKGCLRIQGSGEFRLEVLAMLARIMESPVGTRLLAALSAGVKNKRTVTIGEGQPSKKLAQKLHKKNVTESQAIPFGKSDDDVRRRAAVRRLEKPPRNAKAYPPVQQAIDLQMAVMAGAKGVRVVVGDELRYYEFGPGVKGVLVALVLGTSGFNRDAAGRAIHTPAFVTLAHELGHALNMLAGSATLWEMDIAKAVGIDLGTYENPSQESATWSNPEEIFNILGIENAVRGDVGLDLRGGHAAAIDPQFDERLQAGRAMLRALGNALYAGVPPLGRDEALERMEALMTLGGKTVKGAGKSEKLALLNEYEETLLETARWVAENGGGEKANAVLPDAWKDACRRIGLDADVLAEYHLPLMQAILSTPPWTMEGDSGSEGSSSGARKGKRKKVTA